MMADFAIKSIPLDEITIDCNNQSELEYWSEQLKCASDELIPAISTAGNSIQAIRSYFRSMLED